MSKDKHQNNPDAAVDDSEAQVTNPAELQIDESVGVDQHQAAFDFAVETEVPEPILTSPPADFVDTTSRPMGASTPVNSEGSKKIDDTARVKTFKGQQIGREKVIKQVSFKGAVVNLFLSLMQLIGGWFSGSAGLIADGLHTLSDLISDAVVMVTAHLADEPADDKHPYGHGRFHTLATIIMGLLLLAFASVLFFNSIQSLVAGSEVSSVHSLALIFVAVTILAKEGLFQYTRIQAEKINSKLLYANAVHHRLDVWSSFVVAIGVFAAVMFDVYWVDKLAALVVAGFVAFLGVKMVWVNIGELADTAAPQAVQDAVNKWVETVPGVESYHAMRTRMMGDDVLVDMHVQVNPYLTISEGHFVAESIIEAVKDNVKEVTDVVVHIDAENELGHGAYSDFPDRQALMNELFPVLASFKLSDAIEHINLHYLQQAIEVDLTLSEPIEQVDMDDLVTQIKALDKVSNVKIYHKLN